MDKKVLQDYIDACELVKETEQEIRRISRKKETVIQTNVKGSSHEFPYTPQHFKIQGTTFTAEDDRHLRYEEKLLKQRKENAEKIKLQVEEWMLTIPARMQRIIKYRYMDGMTWEETAEKMGRNVTIDSVRKELERFFQKK